MITQAQKAAWILVGVFGVAYLVSLISNPLVGPNGVFKTNTVHDLVHLLTAISFLVVAKMGEKASVLLLKGFGFVYLGVTALGFITLGSAAEAHLLGIIHINMADNFLHLVLAIAIITMGFVTAPKALDVQQ